MAVAVADLAVDEGLEHLDGHRVKRLSRKRGNPFRCQDRPCFRQVKPAVTGEACQDRIAKRKRGRFASRGNVPHERVISMVT
jgi:hypothetical protein